jgi:ribulose-5-phosphate 4-epimerase/fuculose-1-phosphate aldolase
MVVTATNSDKSHLLLFAETPLVVEKEGVLIYHGDPSRPPSSEAVPHWFIHSHLSAHGLEAWRCILHVHSDPLNTLAQAGDVKLDGGIFLPTVPHVEYGTERMGRLLAEAMTRCGTTGASVQNHGQWFVAQSFPAVLAQAVHAHEAANEKLRGAKKRRV